MPFQRLKGFNSFFIKIRSVSFNLINIKFIAIAVLSVEFDRSIGGFVHLKMKESDSRTTVGIFVQCDLYTRRVLIALLTETPNIIAPPACFAIFRGGP